MNGRERRTDIVLRALEIEDAAELARLQAMPGYRFGTLRPPFPTAAATAKHLAGLGPNDLLLGAFIDDRLVGTAGLHRLGGRRRHAASLGMGVADDMNGQGIGTALLEALIEAADKWLDIRRIELTVFVDNERAIRLYERHGFQREGVMRAYAFRDGRYVDTLAMARLRDVRAL
jgi:putative acetyltransferase